MGGRPDIGIQGMTIEHLNGLRKRFDCYYDEIFLGLYGIDKIDHRLVNLLRWSVEKGEGLPSKEDLLKYQGQFDKEKEAMNYINDLIDKQDK